MTDDPKLYFDCTSTIRSDLNTGVQRVVRGLLAQKEVFERELGIEFVPICHQFDWYYHLDDALRMADEGRADPASPKISFGFRDIYLCADAFWTMGMTEWLPFIHGRGTTIVNVIYDLIPLTSPQFFSPDDIEGFRTSLDSVIKHADLLPCISRSTRAELTHYLDTHFSGKAVPHTGVFTLAPGLRPGQAESQSVERDVSSGEYMLAVGTLEPRKGIMRLLDEFETVWDRGNAMPLVLVGKVGAGADAIVARIDALLAQGRPLSWRSNVCDDELKALYAHASAVICASHAEGYGLPLAEALTYGRPVYANRLPVFGEFAGSYPVYFDISRPGELADLVCGHADRAAVARHDPGFATWAESAAELSALIREVAPMYKLGVPPFKQRTSLASVAWGYRMIFGRELESVEAAQHWVERCPSIPELSVALQGELRNAERPLSAEAVRWTYRVLLDREVDSGETVKFWQARCPTIASLRDELTGSMLSPGSALTPETINLAYRMILGRNADADAMAYWKDSDQSFGQLRAHLLSNLEN